MGHDTPNIDVATRERTGTRYARRLRDSGRLPAVIYGQGGGPVHVSADSEDLLRSLREGGHVMEVCIDGDQTETCLVKDLQFGHLGDDVVHVDFARVNLDQVVAVNVPVSLSGEAKGTKAEGAMLVVIRSEIEVRCKVKDIPSEIKADITELEEALTIGELDLPDGVEAVLEDEKHICHITIKALEEEETAGEETDVDAEGAEPEVIGGTSESDAASGSDSETENAGEG